MPKSLTFIFIVFMKAKFYFKKICFKKHRMTSPHKIVINVDIGMLLTWNFQKTFKTKFGSLKNRSRPKACHNFSIWKEKFWQGKIYPPPWRIRLNQCLKLVSFLSFRLLLNAAQCCISIPPENIRKALGLLFSEGIDKQHWAEMG